MPSSCRERSHRVDVRHRWVPWRFLNAQGRWGLRMSSSTQEEYKDELGVGLQTKSRWRRRRRGMEKESLHARTKKRWHVALLHRKKGGMRSPAQDRDRRIVNDGNTLREGGNEIRPRAWAAHTQSTALVLFLNRSCREQQWNKREKEEIIYKISFLCFLS